MKRLLAVPAALLFGASSLLSAASSVPANHPNPATDAAITVPPAAIAAGNAYWKRLGVTPPKGGFILVKW